MRAYVLGRRQVFLEYWGGCRRESLVAGGIAAARCPADFSSTIALEFSGGLRVEYGEIASQFEFGYNWGKGKQSVWDSWLLIYFSSLCGTDKLHSLYTIVLS